MKKTLLALLIIITISPLFKTIYANQVYFTLIGEVSFNSEPTDIVLYDNAYILTSEGLYAVTISDPYNVLKTLYPELAGLKSLSFIGHYGYVLNGNNEIGVYDFAKNPLLKRTSISSNGNVNRIKINNGYLYVLNESAGLMVYDVNIADFPVYRNTQIVPFDANGLFVQDYKAYVTSSSAHLSIIDVADISKLTIVGTYTSGVKFFEPYVDGTLAYVPQGSTGVQVLDISKLPNPEWQVNLYGRKNAHQVITSNFYVWVADDKSIEGFFNSGPKAYSFAGNYKFKDKINKMALINGQYLYVCCSDKKLRILRIDYKY